jgi:hypothetical protein
MLNPGEPFPAEGTPSALASLASRYYTSTATSTSGPAASSASQAAVSAPASSNSTLSKGAIAGIAVAGAAICALAAALFFFVGRSRSMKQMLHGSREAPALPPSPMYQHQSFLAPKTEMTDQSSRNSTLQHSMNPHFASFDSTFVGGHDSSLPRYGSPKQNYYSDAPARGSVGSPATQGGELPAGRANSRQV